MTIQQKIKELVKKRKGLAVKLAKYIGKDPQYVYDIYQKNKKVDYITLSKIADYFKLPIEYFKEDDLSMLAKEPIAENVCEERNIEIQKIIYMINDCQIKMAAIIKELYEMNKTN